MFRMSPIYLTMRDSYLNLPTLSYRRFRVGMIMTYNILHNKVNLDLNEFFQLHSNSITRGHNYKIFKPHGQRFVRNHHFSARIVDHWNSLPSAVANASSINYFKKNLDNYTLMYILINLYNLV